MFFPAADTIAFSEGGVESMRLNSSGVLVTTNDASISGLTVGRGGGAVATNTAVGLSTLASGSQTGINNTAIGHTALTSNTSGTENSALGRQALFSNTTGSSNSGLGMNTLVDNTTGSFNTAVGRSALQANTTASNNTAVGYQAGFSNTTGAQQVAIGRQALYTNSTGTLNTAVGDTTLYSNSTGVGNFAGGVSALYANTTGANNIAIGGFNGATNPALRFNTTGSSNIAIGVGALQANTTADNNTAVGHQAGFANTTGAQNAYFGKDAGLSVTTANWNTFIGTQAGRDTTGGTNTFVGASGNGGAGYLVTTGSSNTILGGFSGNQGGLDIRTVSNNIVLSDGDGNPRVRWDSSGTQFSYQNLALGPRTGTTGAQVTLATSPDSHGATTVPASMSFGDTGNFEVRYVRDGGNVFNNSFLRFNTHIGGVFAGVRMNLDVNGNLTPQTDNAQTCGGSGVRWSAIWAANGTIQTSDERQKTDISDSSLGLNFITALKPVSYKWKVGGNTVRTNFESEKGEDGQHEQIVTPIAGKRTHFGLLAQQVKETLGEQDFGGYVYDQETDTYALRYDEFISPLIKAIQELKAEVDSLKAQLNNGV
jgi:hypothetical protein